MKVLSLLQPWASLVVLGHKQIETRSWNTKYRGPLLIHASLGKKGLIFIDKKDPFGELATELLKLDMQFYDYPLGAIIGQVNLRFSKSLDFPQKESDSDNSYWHDFGRGDKRNALFLTKQEKAFGDYSSGRYGWLLSDPIQFPVIIPAKGQLGLWEYYLPEKIGYNVQGGGHASFDGMPTFAEVEALEKMMDKAKQMKFPL